MVMLGTRQQGHGLKPVPSCCLICTKRPLSDPSRPIGACRRHHTPVKKGTLVSCRSTSLPNSVKGGSCRRNNALLQLTGVLSIWGLRLLEGSGGESGERTLSADEAMKAPGSP